MSNRMREAQARLIDRLAGRGGKEVVYSDGTHSVTLTALAGSTLLKLQDQYGVVVMQRTDRDFLFARGDLVLGGVAAKPERGHTIAETVGGVTRTYEVGGPEGEPAYRLDPERTAYRVHTHLLSEVAA